MYFPYLSHPAVNARSIVYAFIGERDPAFKSGFVRVNAGGRIHLVLLDSSKSPLRHFILSMVSFLFGPLYLICSSTSYSAAHALFFPPLQNPTLFLKHHHHPLSKHAHTIALHSPWLVHPKHQLNPANS